MKVHSISKDVGIPPRKVRLIVDMVRGKTVDEALVMLKFVPSPAARAVAKTIKSAAANAENNYEMTPSDLKVVEIQANEGRTMKRHRPQGRGRVNPILKRSTNIVVSVSEGEK
ncbi:MAG: 50S ribosomal protein L22 [Dehalococcoidia bacterium]|jgi:large subunit ribosomal protein L22